MSQISSKDIDPSKYSSENLQRLRDAFPGLADELLARYLIARNNDVEKAIEQLTKAQKIREQNWPILKSSCINEMKTGKLFAHGFDKEGRPLLIWNSRCNIAKERNLEETSRLLIWWTEHTLKKRMPGDKSKFTVLIDRSGHSHENSDIELMRHTAGTFQDLFPETMYRCIIYPADFLFYTLWNIVKWFLDPVTRNKVQPVLTFAGVEQFVDRQYIPATMGGDSHFVFNPDDFEENFSSEELKEFSKKEGVEKEEAGSFFVSTHPSEKMTESEKAERNAAEEEFNNEKN